MSVDVIGLPRRARIHPFAALRGPWELRVGAAVLVALLVFSLLALFVLPDPLEQNLNESYGAPLENGHLLGTDPLGRDVLSWIAGGIRTGLQVGIAVVALSASFGVFVGVIAGYYGGFVDALLMRLVDLQLAIPPLVLFVAASAVIEASMLNLILLISVVSWVPYARLVRARVLSERQRGYIAAAQLAGASRMRIMWVHLARSCSSVIVIFATLQIAMVLLAETALSFLGLGLQPPATSLGVIIAEARTDLAGLWWCAAFPGAALLLLVSGSNLLGDGLRDVFQEGEAIER